MKQQFGGLPFFLIPMLIIAVKAAVIAARAGMRAARVAGQVARGARAAMAVGRAVKLGIKGARVAAKAGRAAKHAVKLGTKAAKKVAGKVKRMDKNKIGRGMKKELKDVLMGEVTQGAMESGEISMARRAAKQKKGLKTVTSVKSPKNSNVVPAQNDGEFSVPKLHASLLRWMDKRKRDLAERRKKKRQLESEKRRKARQTMTVLNVSSSPAQAALRGNNYGLTGRGGVGKRQRILDRITTSRHRQALPNVAGRQNFFFRRGPALTQQRFGAGLV